MSVNGLSLENLTRYEILDKFTVQQLREILKAHNILFNQNQDLYTLISIWFNYFKEPRRIYTDDQLDKLKPNTVYKLCQDLNITTLKARGNLNNFQKINLILNYQNYRNSLQDTQLETIYPQNSFYLFIKDLSEAKFAETTELKLSQLNEAIIAQLIQDHVEIIQTPTSEINLAELLYFLTDQQLDIILTHFGYPTQFLTLNDKTQLLLWHLYLDIPIIKNNPVMKSPNLTEYIVGQYKHNCDLSSILFMFNTHLLPPIKYQIQDPDRYNFFLQNRLKAIEYNKLYPTNKLIPAYANLAIQPVNILEPCLDILSVGTEEHLDNLSARFGILIPTNHLFNKRKYLLQNLSYYKKIFRRNVGTPPVWGTDISELEWYTDAELFNYYDLTEITEFDSRIDLLKRIQTLLEIPVHWHFITKKPSNPNLHFIMIEPREDTKENPLISYGSMIRYQTFNLDELDESFRTYEEEGFRFKNPISELDFMLSEIVELIRLLKERHSSDSKNCENVVIPNFVDKLKHGFTDLSNTANKLKQMGNSFSQNMPDLLKVTMIIFIAGMYMRKWQGPGSPFPHHWVDKTSKEEHVFRNEMSTQMISAYFQTVDSSNIREHLIRIPRIKFNFKTKEMNLGLETIYHIMGLAAVANFCLSNGSDIFLQTSYAILVHIFQFSLGQINQEIKNYLEHPAQPDFNPDLLEFTKHKDPINKTIDL